MPENQTIEIVGGVTPGGKWVFFQPEADFSKIDESKIQHFAFKVEAQTTKHGIAANGIVFEVLERLGLLSPLEDEVTPGAYDGALRLAVTLLRCTSVVTDSSTISNPKASDFFELPPDVLRKYQIELRRQDELTKDDFAFFTKALPEIQPEESLSGDKSANEEAPTNS